MTATVPVEVRYLGPDLADDAGPDDHLVHHFEIVAVDEPGHGSPLGPCGIASARLDHGISIDADPMCVDGLVRARIEVPGAALLDLGADLGPDDEPDDRADAQPLDPLAATLLTDLYGPDVTRVLADHERLRNTGDAERAQADPSRWDTARRLAHLEAEARRHHAPTDTAPSLWAAESTMLAQRLSTALEAWATTRATAAAGLLRLLHPQGTRAELDDLWPQFTALALAVRHLSGAEALGPIDDALRHEPPEPRDTDSALRQLRELLVDLETVLLPEAALAVTAYRAPVESRGRRVEGNLSIGVTDEAAVVVEEGSLTALFDPDTRRVTVAGTLTPTAAEMAGAPAGTHLLTRELGLRCWDLDHHTVLADAGIELDGPGLTSVIHLPRSADLDPSGLDVEVFRRGHDHHIAPHQRRADEAMLRSREALEATQILLAVAPSEDRSRELRRAARAWQNAEQAWSDAGVVALADRCRDLDEACLAAAVDADANGELRDTLPGPMVTELIRPGIRRVLERNADHVIRDLKSLTPGQPASDLIAKATTLAKATRTLGLSQTSAELTVAHIRARIERDLPVDERLLSDTLWSSLAEPAIAHDAALLMGELLQAAD